jgi:hypothetical protein
MVLLTRWSKMGTLQLTYLPSKRKIYRLRSEMSELVKSNEDWGSDVHVKEN